MPKAPSFSSIRQILDGLIAQYGLEGPMAEHRLREQWVRLVGDQIASHAKPEQIRFRKLYLAVDSPAWMQELAFLKPTLLEKINTAMEKFEVDEIILRLAAPPPPAPSAAKPKSRRKHGHPAP